MPTDLQSILVYAIVLVALVWLVWRFVKKRRCVRPGCPPECGCGDGVRRDPAIQRFMDKRAEGKK